MLKILEYNIGIIMFSLFLLALLLGLGSLIFTDLHNQQERYMLCLDAGKQYIQGNCVE